MCLEVRPPGQPRTHATDTESPDEEITRIQIRTLETQWNVSDVNANLLQSVDDILTSFEEASQVFEVLRFIILFDGGL